jgi:hypothetical protein
MMSLCQPALGGRYLHPLFSNADNLYQKKDLLSVFCLLLQLFGWTEQVSMMQLQPQLDHFFEVAFHDKLNRAPSLQTKQLFGYFPISSCHLKGHLRLDHPQLL